jgi:uncharacterized SAM-binding protein YcdF (DUF218 family)
MSRTHLRTPARRRAVALLRSAAVGGLLLVTSSCAYYRIDLRKEKLGDSDVIVVPGMELSDAGEGNWILWNRMLMARLLFEVGRGERIVVTGGVPKAGVTESDKMLEFAELLGIPRGVLLAEPMAASSVENGRYSAEMVQAHGYRSALVVTDRMHLFYALPVFRDAYEERGLELYWTPVDYDRLERTEDWCPPGETPPQGLSNGSPPPGARLAELPAQP